MQIKVGCHAFFAQVFLPICIKLYCMRVLRQYLYYDLAIRLELERADKGQIIY